MIFDLRVFLVLSSTSPVLKNWLPSPCPPSLSLFLRPQPPIPLGNSQGAVSIYPGSITMAKTATQSPHLTSDCSSNSASPEPAVPVIQSVFRVKSEPGSRGNNGAVGALDLPDNPADGDDDMDMYEDFEDEPKSEYSSDHETREAISANWACSVVEREHKNSCCSQTHGLKTCFSTSGTQDVLHHTERAQTKSSSQVREMKENTLRSRRTVVTREYNLNGPSAGRQTQSDHHRRRHWGGGVTRGWWRRINQRTHYVWFVKSMLQEGPQKLFGLKYLRSDLVFIFMYFLFFVRRVKLSQLEIWKILI